MCITPLHNISPPPPPHLKVLLPLCIRGVDNIVHRRLRFGYDVGKGFVMGEEEMLQQFDRFGGLVHKKIALELRRRAEATRLEVIMSLGTCTCTCMSACMYVHVHVHTCTCAQEVGMDVF